jgi:hypothetical protein
MSWSLLLLILRFLANLDFAVGTLKKSESTRIGIYAITAQVSSTKAHTFINYAN